MDGADFVPATEAWLDAQPELRRHGPAGRSIRRWRSKRPPGMRTSLAPMKYVVIDLDDDYMLVLFDDDGDGVQFCPKLEPDDLPTTAEVRGALALIFPPLHPDLLPTRPLPSHLDFA